MSHFPRLGFVMWVGQMFAMKMNYNCDIVHIWRQQLKRNKTFYWIHHSPENILETGIIADIFLEKLASFFLKTVVKLNNSGTVSTFPKLQSIAALQTVHPSHICRILTTRWTLGGRPLMYWFSLHPAVLLQLHNYCISSAWVCCRLHAISRTCQPVFIAFPKKPSMRLMDFNRSLACNQIERSFSTKVTRFYHKIKVKINGEGLSF